jgi:hypothetical protein
MNKNTTVATYKLPHRVPPINAPSVAASDPNILYISCLLKLDSSPFSPDINDLDALTNDTCFLDLKNWFLQPEIMETYDVREVDKRNIFNPDFRKTSYY